MLAPQVPRDFGEAERPHAPRRRALEPLHERRESDLRRVREQQVYVVALEVRLGEDHAERFTDLSPRDAHRLKDALRDDLAPVLRREDQMGVQAVDRVR